MEDKYSSPITISVCMIVRDEEPVLERCLKSVSRFADELIVVDTGSYYEYLGISLVSVMENTRESQRFHILCDGTLSDSARDELRRICEGYGQEDCLSLKDKLRKFYYEYEATSVCARCTNFTGDMIERAVQKNTGDMIERAEQKT